MKSFRDMKREQRDFCSELFSKAFGLVQGFEGVPGVSAVLLTGSVARGDARMGPFGVLVDLLFVLDNCVLDFEPVFGPDREPGIPFYCGAVEGVSYQIQSVEKKDFVGLPKVEDQSFALGEAKILVSNDQVIDLFINENFRSLDQPRKDLALHNCFRFDYLTNSYRLEKWLYREAFLQISENYHSALICFARFLYAINNSFIPRDDWMIYLLFELELIPENLKIIIETLQSGAKNEEDVKRIQSVVDSCRLWMSEQIQFFGW